MNDLQHDWQSLGEEWRGQDAPGIDIDALRAEAARRGTKLKLALGLEVATSIAVVAALAVIIGGGTEPRLFNALCVVMTVAVVAFQAWSLWIRRRQLRDEGLDAAALLALESERARTSLRYWRYGMWVGLVLWLLTCAVGVTLAWQAGASELGRLIGGMTGGGIGLVLSALMAWYITRKARARLLQLRALQDELGDG